MRKISFIVRFLLVFIILTIFSFTYYNLFRCSYEKASDWITSVSNLILMALGALATIYAVIKTINYTNIQKNNLEKEEIRLMALQVYSEIEGYIQSVNDYTYNILNLKIESALCKSCSGREFEEKCNSYIWINDIYFMSDNIKEVFYKLINKSDLPNKENLIQTFIKLNINHERTKKIFYSNKRRTIELMNNMGFGIFKEEFINYRIYVYSVINYDELKYHEKNLNDFNKYCNKLNSIKNKFSIFKEVNTINVEILILINELKNLYEKNS